MKLFIEEAREELAKIQQYFPVWDQNPAERDALVTVRRSFHTLKGSGRMVGARDLGEFAWSIENLVNRVLDNTLTRSPAILETLRAAVAALPQLVAQLDSGAAAERGCPRHLLARARARRRPPGGRRPRRRRGHGGGGRRVRPPPDVHRHRRRPHGRAGRAVTGPGSAPPAAAGREARDPGRHAARHLRARDRRARGHGAHLPGARGAAARAARPARGRLPRLPHAVRQLEDGAGAPRHPPRRAARSLAAARLRQRPGTGHRGSLAAR